jgi:hypothetical protein
MSRYQLASPNKQKIGVILFIFPLVASQFLSINLFIFLGIVISVEKLAALALYPVALALIGLKNIRVTKELVIFGILYVLTFLMYRLFHWESVSYILSPIILMGIHLFVLVVLFSISRLDENSIKTFFIIWISFSVVTSIICILQSIQLLPVISTPINYHGAIRAEGLLEDPNYQAMVLLFGLTIILNRRLSFFSSVAAIIVFLGIISTFSRMGFLGVGLVVLATLVLSVIEYLRYKSYDKKKKLLTFLILLLVLSSVFLIAYKLLPSFGKAFQERMNYLLEAFRQVLTALRNQNDISSGVPSRYRLFLQGLSGFVENLPLGVGFGNVTSYMKEAIGVNIYLHNTYMEYLLMGGIFGLAMFIYSVYLIGRSVLVSLKNLDHSLTGNILAFTLVGMFVLLFLSINESIVPVIIITLNLIAFDNLRKVRE